MHVKFENLQHQSHTNKKLSHSFIHYYFGVAVVILFNSYTYLDNRKNDFQVVFAHQKEDRQCISYYFRLIWIFSFQYELYKPKTFDWSWKRNTQYKYRISNVLNNAMFWHIISTRTIAMYSFDSYYKDTTEDLSLYTQWNEKKIKKKSLLAMCFWNIILICFYRFERQTSTILLKRRITR